MDGGFGGGLGAAEGSIRLDASGALSALDSVGAGLKNLDRQSAAGGSGMLSWAKQNEQAINTVGLGMAGLGATFLGAFGFGVKSASDFESALSELRVATGATGEDLDRLRDLALRLGKETSFSATEAAAAITELGKAGLSTQQIYDGAADAVVNLATAGEVDLASAATILTGAMNAYGLSASDAVMITDTLARGAAVSSADLGDLAQGLTYVGTTANALGVPITDTTAALAALNDQNIKGSMAGTALNQMLSSLINPGTKAAGAMADLGLAAGGTFAVIDEGTGQFKDLGTIIKNVDQATAGLTETERLRYLNMIFGEQGGRAVNALLQTQTEEAKKAGKGWEDYATGVTDGTTAAEMGAAKMDNLAGDIEQLKGGLETLAITATSAFLPMFRAIVQGLDAFVGALTSLPGPLQIAIAGFVGLSGVLLAGAGGFLLMLPRIAAMRDALQALGGMSGVIGKLGQALRALTLGNPLMWVLAAAIGAVVAYKTNFLGFADAVDGLVNAFKKLSIVQDIANWVGGLKSSFDAFFGAFGDKASSEVQKVTKEFDGLNETVENADGTTSYFYTELQDDGTQKRIGEIVDSTLDADGTTAQVKIKTDDGEYWATVDMLTGEITGTAEIEVTAETKDARKKIERINDGLEAMEKTLRKRNLPFLADLVKGVQKGVQAFDAFQQSFRNLRASGLDPVRSALLALGNAVPALQGPLGVVYGLVDRLTSIWGRLTDAFRMFRSVGMDPVSAGLASLMTVFPKLTDIISPLIEAVRNVKEAFTAFLDGDVEKGFSALGDAIGNVWDAITEGASRLASTVRNAVTSIDWSGIGATLWSGVQSAVAFLWGLVLDIPEVIVNVINWAKGTLPDLWAKVTEWASAAWDAVKATAHTIWGVLVNLGSWGKGIVTDMWPYVKTWASAAWDAVKATAFTIWDILVNLGSWAKGIVSDIWPYIKKFAAAAWEAVKDSAYTVWGVLVNVGSWAKGSEIADMAGAIDDAVEDAYAAYVAEGKAPPKIGPIDLQVSGYNVDPNQDALNAELDKAFPENGEPTASDAYGKGFKYGFVVVQKAVDGINEGIQSFGKWLTGGSGGFETSGLAIGMKVFGGFLLGVAGSVDGAISATSNAMRSIPETLWQAIIEPVTVGLGKRMAGGAKNMVDPFIDFFGDVAKGIGVAWDEVKKIDLDLPDLSWPDMSFSMNDMPFVKTIQKAINSFVGWIVDPWGIISGIGAPSLSWPNISLNWEDWPFVKTIKGQIDAFVGWITDPWPDINIPAPDINWPGGDDGDKPGENSHTFNFGLDPSKLGRNRPNVGAAGVDTSWLDELPGKIAAAQAAVTAAATALGQAAGAAVAQGVLNTLATFTAAIEPWARLITGQDGAVRTAGTTVGQSGGAATAQGILNTLAVFTTAVATWAKLITAQDGPMKAAGTASGQSGGAGAAQGVLNTMATFTAAVQTWAKLITNQSGPMKSAGTGVGEGAGAATAQGVLNTMGTFRAAVGAWANVINGAAGGMGAAGYNAGAAAGYGVANGLSSALGSVRAAANDIIATVDSALRKAAEIRSPSRLTARLGALVGEGFAVGIHSMIPDVARATAALVSTPGGTSPGALRYAYAGAPGGGGGSVTNVTVYALKSEEWLHMVQTAEGAPAAAVRAMIDAQAAVPAGKV